MNKSNDSVNVERDQPSFAAVGDIFLGDQPICLGLGVRSLAKGKGYRSLFTNVRDTFARYELVTGNLETVIAGHDALDSSKSAVKVDRADPQAAAALREAGIGLVGLANNHIFEYGENGLAETVRHLDENGIKWVGRKNYRIEKIQGKEVAFLSWSLLPNTYWPGLEPAAYYNVARDVAPVLGEVTKLRGAVDYIVLLLHWGNEFVHSPSPKQREIGHALVDAGVDVIVGHHPHVLQPIETYKGSLIAYSLGNFVIDSWDQACRSSIILKVILSSPVSYEVVPIYIGECEYRPTVVTDEARQASINAAITPGESLQEAEYLREVFEARKRYRVSSLIHFVRNIHRVGLANLLWVLAWGIKRIVFLAKVLRQEKRDPNIVYRGPMRS